MRSVTTRLLLIFLVVSALAVGLAGSASATVEGPPAPPQSQVLVLEPTNSTLRPDEQQVFTAFSGPPDQNGDPDVGDDGVPGTSDDQFQAVSVDWSTNGGIGTVNPTSGTSTTLTAALTFVPLVGDLLAFHADGRTASANVTVEPQPILVLEPTNSTLRPDEQQVFMAFSGPPNPDGTPNKGDDGVAGTADDDFQPADVSFSTTGGMGSLDPLTGTSTTLTAALTFVPLVGDLLAFDADGRTASANVTVEPQQILVLEPTNSTLRPDEQQVFMAFSGPPNPDGSPNLGPDGVPGTGDDQFQGVSVDWATSGEIGTVEPASGSSTTLTAGNVAASGQVIATHADGRTAAASVTVEHEPLTELVFIDPDTINLNAKGMYLTAYIEAAFDLTLIEIGSLRLRVVSPFTSPAIPVAPGAPTAVGDGNGNGVLDLMVKFDRRQVQSWFGGPTAASFQVFGSRHVGDVMFVTQDAAVRIISAGSVHTNESNPGSVQP